MNNQALIFGAKGQDSYYLNLLLKNNGVNATLVSRSAGKWISGNVSDYNFVENLIKFIRPDYIFYLVANSSTKMNFCLKII